MHLNTPAKASAPRQMPATPKPKKTRRRLPKPAKPIIRGIAYPRAKVSLAAASFEVASLPPFDWDEPWPNVAVLRGHHSWSEQLAAGQSVLASMKADLTASKGKCLSRLCHRIQEDRKRIGIVERPTKCRCSWCELEQLPPGDKRHRRSSMH